jgi:ubiquinone biosynthesis protein
MSIQWLRTGRQLGQAVKNVQSLKQILAILAKHGFADVVHRMDLGRFLPGSLGAFAESQAEKTVPERLKLAIEELGPTFVKLGQLLSTRSDLLPEAFLEEFTQLQDNVQPLAFDLVKSLIERELGKKLEEAYLTFNSTPLAAASIGQVHEATLMSGDQVVVKVQRPEIEKVIETDISLLAFLATLLEKYVPETRVIGPSVIVNEFFRTLSFELDFIVEANNIAKIAENTISIPEVVIPKVFRNFTTHKILTLEKLEGIRVNDLKAIDAAGIDRKKVVEIGARFFFKSVMLDGLFHGDLHGGNVFILPGNRLGIVDFGIVGRLSQKARDQLANMVLSLLTEDYENLCYEYAELGTAGASVDFESFQREVRNALSPYMGLSLQELNVGRILIEATQIATKYDIKIPGDWMLVFKAILTIEGMGRGLDPNFDLLAMGQDLIKDLVKSQYSFQRVSKEFMWVAKDVAVLLKTMPRQIRWMFRKFNSNDFAFEIKSPDLREIRTQMDLNGQRTSLSILVAGLFIASSIAMHQTSDQHLGNYPLVAVVYFSGGVLFLVSLLLKVLRKK